MTDDAKTTFQEVIQREKARLVAEAEAEISRDMAEFERIALKYSISVDTFLSIIKAAPVPVSGAVATTPTAEQEASRSYDGTFKSLIDNYCSLDESSFHNVKHSVQQNYLRSFRRLKKDIGSERVAECSAQRIQSLYDSIWAADGKVAMGHDMIAKLRLLATFGSTVLNDDGCIRLSTILGNMRFAVAKGDGQPRFTRDQARALRIAAREHFGWDSIALAVALLFEVPKLKQVDVLGEWVPLSDPTKSDIIKGSEKWVRGLRWSDLDDDLVLHRVSPRSRREQQKEQQFRLSRSQMTMEEINRVPEAKRNGPMVICEFSGLPWSGNEFRRKLKIVAEKAGVSLRSKSDDGGDSELEAEKAS
ncbi:hypothetical protein [Bradyrhizobium sp. CCBAU 45384]|uniref:hypothetical protein n=1 Tax=Bradyrhizobium sp. CCBAU 45384 TaxID=858428 RepID=UPI0023062340|nr:hypothetical protein [Bradyrhizobium sp. CCBAU 45384]MDA9408028.1 hypothetical protein [Bradyrhizobium sp. CCBAU 45384]